MSSEDIAKTSKLQDGSRFPNAIFWDVQGQSGHCCERFHRFLASYQFCTGQGYFFLIALDYKGMKVSWTDLDQA